MRVSRRGKIAFFLTFGVVLASVAVAVGFGWIILNWQHDVKVLLGIIFFGAIATGLILNTTFLVREIRRNEQHDAFVNAVTHELKTPITSIRLHLETLKAREPGVEEQKRREFYDVMLRDTDRLLHTVEQVLHAGQAGRMPRQQLRVDLLARADECVRLTRTQRHLPEEAVQLTTIPSAPVEVMGDPGQLRGAVLNLLDNAVKYSSDDVHVEVEVARSEHD